ncbi:MAG: response regulator transcription factor [Deinococcales bacterium]
MAKIVAVDDSMADLKFAESILLGAGHRVALCINGEGVEALIAQEQPDVILLDVVMPQRNGYEILRKLRRDQVSKNIPICIISSKDQPTDIEWGKRQGATDYLPKPYTPDALLAVVTRLLTGKE